MRYLVLHAVLLAASAGAQTASPPVLHTAPADPVRFPPEFYPAANKPPTVEGPVVGAPFQGRFVATSRETRDNGVVETQTTTVERMRDSAGRVRIKIVDPRALPVKDASIVQVRDPVSHCVIEWEEPRLAAGDKPTAYFTCEARLVVYGRQPGPIWEETPEPDGAVADAEAPLATAGKQRISQLPEAVIEGVRTTGERIETDQPGDGLNAASHEVRLTRYSPELHELMLDDTDWFNDAGRKRRGTVALTEVRLGEPDARLFYPPAGYELVNRPQAAIKPSED